MKTTLTSATLSLVLMGGSLIAADSLPPELSAEQQFHQIEVQVALEHYKKLLVAAAEIGLKIDLGSELSQEQKKALALQGAAINRAAAELRADILRKSQVAGVALAKPELERRARSISKGDAGVSTVILDHFRPLIGTSAAKVDAILQARLKDWERISKVPAVGRGSILYTAREATFIIGTNDGNVASIATMGLANAPQRAQEAREAIRVAAQDK